MAENNASGSQVEQGGQQSQVDTTNTQSQADSSKDNSQNDKQTYTREEYERLQRNKHESDNEAKNLRARLKALETEKETAEQERLKKQGEFETLYQQEQAKVKELEPVLDENKFLRDYAMRQLEKTIADWPEEALKTDPGKKAPLQQRLDWIENMSPLVAKLQGQSYGSANRGGNSFNPRPAGQVGPKTTEEYEKEFRRMGKI